MKDIFQRAGLTNGAEANGTVISAGGGVIGVNGSVTDLGLRLGNFGLEDAARLAEVLGPNELILFVPQFNYSAFVGKWIKEQELTSSELVAAATWAILPRRVLKVRGYQNVLPRNYAGKVIRQEGDTIHRVSHSGSETVPILEPSELKALLELRLTKPAAEDWTSVLPS